MYRFDSVFQKSFLIYSKDVEPCRLHVIYSGISFQRNCMLHQLKSETIIKTDYQPHGQ